MYLDKICKSTKANTYLGLNWLNPISIRYIVIVFSIAIVKYLFIYVSKST